MAGGDPAGQSVNDPSEASLALFETHQNGLGVRAVRPFREGEQVLTFHGPLLSTESIRDFTHTIQVDSGLFLGASGELDDFVNHSCDPNCGLVSDADGLHLVALRDVEPGEEITFDYSTCLLEEPALEDCHCSSARCRGRVGAWWDLEPSARNRYRRLRVVPEFVLRSRPSRLSGRLRGSLN